MQQHACDLGSAGRATMGDCDAGMHAMSHGAMNMFWLVVLAFGSSKCLELVRQGPTLRGVTMMGLS